MILKCTKCGEDVERSIFRPYAVCFLCKKKHDNEMARKYDELRRQRAKADNQRLIAKYSK